MQREAMLITIIEILTKNKEYFVVCNITDKMVNNTIKRVKIVEDAIPVGKIQHTMDWLKCFERKQLIAVKSIYTEHTPDEWKMLKIFASKQPEENLLKDTIKEARVAWRERPSFLKPPKKKKKKD